MQAVRPQATPLATTRFVRGAVPHYPFTSKEEFMDTPMAVVKRAYQAFGRNDIEGVLECIAPTVDWRVVGPASLPYPTQCHTRQEVARFFKELAADGDITVFEPR